MKLIQLLQAPSKLVIEVPKKENPEDDVLALATKESGYFHDQLYIFESVGSLVAIRSDSPPTQMLLIQGTTDVLIQDIHKLSQLASADPLSIITVHHSIMALGSLAKGLPDSSNENLAPWTGLFQSGCEAILLSLSVYSQERCIREAVSDLRILSECSLKLIFRPGSLFLA